MLRDKAEFEEATQLKMTFLDKKIKELIDTIERKESIIEKTKSSKCELEDKMKMYEDNIRRLMDEAEGCKRAKGDVVRKDELMRDYKTRMEKAKLEAE